MTFLDYSITILGATGLTSSPVNSVAVVNRALGSAISTGFCTTCSIIVELDIGVTGFLAGMVGVTGCWNRFTGFMFWSLFSTRRIAYSSLIFGSTSTKLNKGILIIC